MRKDAEVRKVIKVMLAEKAPHFQQLVLQRPAVAQKYGIIYETPEVSTWRGLRDILQQTYSQLRLSGVSLSFFLLAACLVFCDTY